MGAESTSAAGPDTDAAETTGSEGLRAGAVGLAGALGVTLSNMAPVNGVSLTAPAVVAAMGTRAPWAFLLATFGMLAAALAVGSFARRIVSPGSFVAYTYHAFESLKPGLGTWVASATFYATLVSGPLTIGAVAVFSGQWIAASLGLGGLWWLAASLGVVAFAAAVVLRGIVTSSAVALALAVVQLALLVGFALVLLVASGGGVDVALRSAGGEPGGFAGLAGLTFPLAVAGMVGWDNSATMSAELRRPRRVVPITVVVAVVIVGGTYALSTWAGLAAYTRWRGIEAGAARFGEPTNTAPFLELAQHYVPASYAVLAVVGVVSSVACLIAALVGMSRISFAAARAGMLPRVLGRASRRRGVPVGTTLLRTGLVVLCVVLPLLLTDAGPATVSAWEAGMGTVPLLLSVLVTLAGLPLYMWRTPGERLRPLPHLFVPLIGIGVLGWGVYGNIRPDQPAPGDSYWIFTAITLVVSVVGALYFTRRPTRDLSALGIASADRPEVPG